MKLEQLKTKLRHLKKAYRPILNHVHISNLGIYCTDLETNILIKNNYGLKEGLKLLDTLSTEIDLPSNVEISEYPIIDVDKIKGETITVKIDDLFRVNQFSSNDETRMFLNCVCFDVDHMVAVDGHKLKAIELDKKLKHSYLVPNTSLKILKGLLGGYKIKDTISFKLSENYAWIDNEFFTMKIRLITREFPKWRTILPKKFEYEFKIDKPIDFKALKPVINKYNKRIILESVSGTVYLKLDEVKDYQGIIIGTCSSSENFIIGVNAEYLDLAANGEKQYSVKFNSSLSPLLINEAIVMPLKVDKSCNR